MLEHTKKMHIIKRNGEKQKVSFDKVLWRLENICEGLNVDYTIVAQKVIARIYDGVKTSELDELAAQVCIS